MSIPSKPKTNILYYRKEGRDFEHMKSLLDELEIDYVCIKVNNKKVTRDFVSLMLYYTENGFEDLIKNPKKSGLDVDEMTTKQLITEIALDPDRYLKEVWVLGKNGLLKSIKNKDELTVFVDYHKREMSKIYE